MKRLIALLMVLMFALCGCGKSQEEKNIEILTQAPWYSLDRVQTMPIDDSWQIVIDNYCLNLYDDGSYHIEYTKTNTGSPFGDGAEQESYTGSWSIEGNIITIYHPLGNMEKHTLGDDGVLYGPKSEGYTYIQNP